MEPMRERLTTQPPDTLAGGPAIRTLAVRFTGTGAAWWRIWIVDLALVLATATLYAPVARARRIAWFRRHTRVGRDALAFHADPWLPCALHALALALLVPAGWLAWRGSVLAALPLALLVLGAPGAWWAARRWRLRHTVWRGVRLDHAADLRRAYGAWWPAQAWALALLGWLGAAAGAPGAHGLAAWPPGPALAGAGAVLLAVGMALAPWWVARLLRHRQGALAWGQERARLLLDVRRVRAWVGRALAVTALAGALTAALALLCLRWLPPLLAWPAVALVGATVAVVLRAWLVARCQNLLWAHTWTPRARGRCELSFRRLAAESLGCAVRVVLTLGLYWPFAQVRLARCRLEAVSIDLEGELPAWGAHAPSARRATAQSTSRRA